jgi:hypothetical protein
VCLGSLTPWGIVPGYSGVVLCSASSPSPTRRSTSGLISLLRVSTAPPSWHSHPSRHAPTGAKSSRCSDLHSRKSVWSFPHVPPPVGNLHGIGQASCSGEALSLTTTHRACGACGDLSTTLRRLLLWARSWTHGRKPCLRTEHHSKLNFHPSPHRSLRRPTEGRPHRTMVSLRVHNYLLHERQRGRVSQSAIGIHPSSIATGPTAHMRHSACSAPVHRVALQVVRG